MKESSRRREGVRAEKHAKRRVAAVGRAGSRLIESRHGEPVRMRRFVELSAAPRKLEEVHMAFQDFVEEVQVLGRDLVDKVKSLVHEGNVRRIIVRDEHGNTFIEIPVSVAAVGAVLAPVLAAVGAISALVAKFTIVIVRTEDKPPSAGEKNTGA